MSQHDDNGAETIHVCSLAVLPELVQRRSPCHLVTCLHDDSLLATPPGILDRRHLRLIMHDIEQEMDGYVAPSAPHVSKLIGFVRSWDRKAPMLIHCYAGISRSTAAAFIALCTLNPETPEDRIAQTLRKASPSATPNRRLIALGDAALDRDGRMIRAAAGIGAGDIALAAPFSIAARVA
ncbi:MAG TPA: protein-tyrosine phosphatase family protein [Hyphomicrobiaceae bacterium]|nr:protein-tyrosine phosphatase family protein [Hyphomicrobiaceae bacterium]